MDIETFAHIVAHDLKAPLNGIASMVDFVVEDYADRLDDDGREQLRLIQSMATRGVAMVDALRRFSKIASAPLAPRTIDLGEVAPRLLADAAARVAAEATVLAEVAPSLPAVVADPALVALLLGALFNNAVTYHRQPTRRVWFSALPEPGRAISPSHVCFAVRDDGIGIPDRFQDAVFDMFRRLHAADKFGGGVGAGLALARTIVDRHGGVLWVAESSDRGTTMAFSLPAGTPAKE